METSSYSAQQRRAINLVWTASGDYQFEPQFLALKSNGEPDFYMNCVIGLVHKWFGDKMPKRLFAYWAGDARQNVFDELCWLALENAAYEKELPERPVLADLRRKHAEEFFASEYQLSRQEWMEKNQLVYAVQSRPLEDDPRAKAAHSRPVGKRARASARLPRHDERRRA